jgi:hypothetical protein
MVSVVLSIVMGDSRIEKLKIDHNQHTGTLDDFVTERREEQSALDSETPDEPGLGELMRDLARVTLDLLLISNFFRVDFDCFAMLSFDRRVVVEQ